MGGKRKAQPNTDVPAEPTNERGLTDKQQAFINAYFVNGFNRTQAYISVYQETKYDAARSSASRLLTNANVRAEIEQRLAEHAMTANEAIARLANEARGDLADVFTDDGEFDFKTAKARGQTAIIKKLKRKRTSKIAPGEDEGVVIEEHFEIELYDAQAAKLALLKQWQLDNGKPTERTEVIWEALMVSKQDDDSDPFA